MFQCIKPKTRLQKTNTHQNINKCYANAYFPIDVNLTSTLGIATACALSLLHHVQNFDLKLTLIHQPFVELGKCDLWEFLSKL